ncbi:MAG: DUF998 domain-containing protein [Nitrososphaerota archaeon]
MSHTSGLVQDKFKTSFDMNRSELIAGCCGIISPVLGIGLVLIATTLSGRFSWERNALSDLGVAEPAAAMLFNSSLILAGVLFLCFVYGLLKQVSDDKKYRSGLAFLLAGGVSLIFIGIFTEHYGVLHFIFSAGYFILTPIGIILIGASRPSRLVSQRVRIISIIEGSSSLFVITVAYLLLNSVGLRVGFAVPELAASLIISFWVIMIAARLIRH